MVERGSYPLTMSVGLMFLDQSIHQVKEALKKLEERERAAMEADGSKRKFNSLDGAGGEMVTPEEMEAFRLKKQREDDPMAKHAAGDKGTGGYEFL